MRLRVLCGKAAYDAPGQIVVIHDGHHKDLRPDRRYAIEATRKIIDGLRARGYSFATLCN